MRALGDLTIVAFDKLSRVCDIAEMGVNLGDILPNFEADTTVGHIKFHDWLKDGM